MNKIYIRNKTDKNLVLLCDSEYTPISEETAEHKPAQDKAFYVKFPGGFIGVYSSMNGPILFINGSKYPFTDPSWKVVVQKNARINEVRFTGPEQKNLTFAYPAVELDPMDPWSEESFDDFFIWLTTKRDDQEFIEMWTESRDCGPA
jgi:hypothetical protein